VANVTEVWISRPSLVSLLSGIPHHRHAGRTLATPSARRCGRDSSTPATSDRLWARTTGPSTMAARRSVLCRLSLMVVDHGPALSRLDGECLGVAVARLGHRPHGVEGRPEQDRAER
jgi:hypothetical protein